MELRCSHQARKPGSKLKKSENKKLLNILKLRIYKVKWRNY